MHSSEPHPKCNRNANRNEGELEAILPQVQVCIMRRADSGRGHPPSMLRGLTQVCITAKGSYKVEMDEVERFKECEGVKLTEELLFSNPNPNPN